MLPPTNVVAGQKCLVQTETSEYKRAVIVDAKATAGVFVEFMDDCGVEECPASKVSLFELLSASTRCPALPIFW